MYAFLLFKLRRTMPQLRDVSNSRHDACRLRQKYDYSAVFGRCQAHAMIA
jgi:hypothetical protein